MRAAAALKVGGVTPFTTIDYPGRLSAVVYVQGCPWRCGYCHNPHLQPRDTAANAPTWDALLPWLRKRAPLLDAVVFSGGEPTLDPALPRAMAEAAELGLSIGLHSAGIYPLRLRAVLPLVDWVGLDVKAPLADQALHDRVVGGRSRPGLVAMAIAELRNAGTAFECRTTAHPEWLADEDLLALGHGLARAGVAHYALQLARPASRLATAAPAGYPSAATVGELRGLFERFTLRSD